MRIFCCVYAEFANSFYLSRSPEKEGSLTKSCKILAQKQIRQINVKWDDFLCLSVEFWWKNLIMGEK